MGLLTSLLFAGEVTFTFLKSVLLFTERGSMRRKFAAVICFVAESVIGVVLSSLLAMQFWGASSVELAKLKAGVILIMCTELLSVITEGQIIRLKVINAERAESGHGSTRRLIVKWLTFVSAEVVLLTIFILSLSKDVGDPQNYFGDRRYTYLILFLANASMMTLSCVFSRRLHLRAMSHVAYFVLGVSVALIFLYGGWFSNDCGGWGAGPNCSPTPTFAEFTISTSISIFSASISTLLTAISSWGLPDVRSGYQIDMEHVKMFETVSLGMTWAAISMGLAQVNAKIVLQVMHTVLPQTGAIVIPFILSFITASLSKSEKNCTANDEV